MRILVDIDNTIENLLDGWFKALNKKYGTNVKAEEVTDWNVSLFFPELTKPQIYGIMKEEGFWKTITPKEDAVEYLPKLVEDGHDVYLCTATDWMDIRPKYEELLSKYFSCIPWEKIIICTNKKMLKADVLIDDGVHNLEGGDYIKILYSQPHNLKYDAEKNGMYRVNHWKEAYEIIKKLSEEKNDDKCIQQK